MKNSSGFIITCELKRIFIKQIRLCDVQCTRERSKLPHWFLVKMITYQPQLYNKTITRMFK